MATTFAPDLVARSAAPALPFVNGSARRRSAMRARGDAARDRGDRAEAARCYAAHVAEQPGDAPIWIQLGHMRKDGGDLAGAAEAYARAEDLQPFDADLLLNVGHLAKRRAAWADAAYAYRRSFALDRNAAAAQELAAPALHPFLAEAERRTAAWREPAPAAALAPGGAIDRIDGWTVTGWAVDPDAGDQPVEILFFHSGREVGRTVPDRFHAEAARIGAASLLAGFEARLDLDFGAADAFEVSARLARTGTPLGGSPARAEVPAEHRGWLRAAAPLAGAEQQFMRARANAGLDGRLLSIVMPVHDTRPDWLRQAIDSVRAQRCDAWELICVDDHSPSGHVREILKDYAAADPRIRPVFACANLGIGGAVNLGLAAAGGDFVAFLDHDDVLEPDAVGEMLRAATGDVDLVYSDEAVTAESVHTIAHVVARPAFSYDYYLSHPYFVHFVAVRMAVARAIGGWDEAMAISADVDFMLRAIERARAVSHVPAILYRWRTHGQSTGHARKDRVTDATVGALNRHLARSGREAVATPGPAFNSFRIDWADDRGRTLVVIPTKDRVDLLERAIGSIRATTDRATTDIVVIDHASRERATRRFLDGLRGEVRVVPHAGPFNFARMNNLAVAAAGTGHDYLLFCNNDVEAIEPGWLEHMRGLCRRADVGAVGATLLYADRTVQHAGVIVGLGGLADHAHKFRRFDLDSGARDPGYNLGLVATRDSSAVTAACLLMRAATFRDVGGFDERYAIGFNDLDLCLRLRARGLKVLADAHAVLYHHESATRSADACVAHPEDSARLARDWAGVIAAGDPFYNPRLGHDPGLDHRADPAGGRPFARPRVVAVG